MKLHHDENIVKQGPANHFKGIEGVGGKLFLTNRRIFFKSHRFNFQNHELSIPLSEIREAGGRNTFLFVPNGILINLKSGNKEKFVVWNRNDWLKKIKIQMQLEQISCSDEMLRLPE
jgi:hypothetical protein